MSCWWSFHQDQELLFQGNILLIVHSQWKIFFLSYLKPGLHWRTIRAVTDVKNFFLSSLAWRKRTSDICLIAFVYPNLTNQSISMKLNHPVSLLGLFPSWKVNLLAHEDHPSTSLDFFLLASLCSEQCYQLLLLLILLNT